MISARTKSGAVRPGLDHPVQNPSRLQQSRRDFIGTLGFATAALTCAVPAWMCLRAYVPNVLYEPPRRLKVGPLARFTEGATYLPDQRAFVFREKDTLFSIGARCTHLGCTVQLAKMPEVEGGYEFHCPCHGSKFRADGTNFAGPAPSPLPYYTLDIAAEDDQLILDMSVLADKGWRLTVRS
ncbi:Rieske 2Fe-2S domain-containing protein [bacterium]|nr:Rieske 2Fe-2S domain-containing protein [bacterium]